MSRANGLQGTDDIWQMDLNYSGENDFSSFFASGSNIHSYPAKAVPKMVKSILRTLKEHYEVKRVLDPFVGSGTVGLESKVLGLDFIGSDLNPLAVLLARTKGHTIHNRSYIQKRLERFIETVREERSQPGVYSMVAFERIDYWFKQETIVALSQIKSGIRSFLKNSSKKHKETFALILLTAFSSTVRHVSLTRNNEFKLYKMSPLDVKRFNPNVIQVFSDNVTALLNMLETAQKQYLQETIYDIKLCNAKQINENCDTKVDLVLTSPPYGDSASTVAYGQFSKLSLQWTSDLLKEFLGISVHAKNCDDDLLGGRRSFAKTTIDIAMESSDTLRRLIQSIQALIDEELCQLAVSLSHLERLTSEPEGCTSQAAVKELTSDELLKTLLRERVRLEIYRSIHNSNQYFSNAEVKLLAKSQMERFFEDLFHSDIRIRARKIRLLQLKLAPVRLALRRKQNYMKKRMAQVTSFLCDLHDVVRNIDAVVRPGGLQAWIVGNRTVFGSIPVDLVMILREWFTSMGYEEVTTLQRQYSFKRMPYQINSTLDRLDAVQTMVHEHILILQKPKY